VLLLRGSLARYALVATPRFVRQSRDALLQKSPCPFVHIAPVESDHRSNVGDRYPISEEEDNPGTSEQSATTGGRPLPRAERLVFLRCEGDGKRGFASTIHTTPLSDTPLSDTGEAQHNMGGQVC